MGTDALSLLLKLSSVGLFAFGVMMVLRALTSFQPHPLVLTASYILGLPATLHGIWWMWREGRR